MQGRTAVIAALAQQEGIPAVQITLRDLSTVTEQQIISAVAAKAGISTSRISVKEISGKEQQRLLSELAAQAGTRTVNVNEQDGSHEYTGDQLLHHDGEEEQRALRG